jgi:hypothetical protein
MSRLAPLMACVGILVGALWLGGCAGCEPNACNEPNSCEPNACNEPNQPNSCNPNPCGGSQYGMTPTQPSIRDGGSGWR